MGPACGGLPHALRPQVPCAAGVSPGPLLLWEVRGRRTGSAGPPARCTLGRPRWWLSGLTGRGPARGEWAFRVEADFPAECAFKPPRAMFGTKTCDPDRSGKGQACVPVIHAGNWEPAGKTDLVIQSPAALAHGPQAERPHSQLKSTARKHSRDAVGAFKSNPCGQFCVWTAILFSERWVRPLYRELLLVLVLGILTHGSLFLFPSY